MTIGNTAPPGGADGAWPPDLAGATAPGGAVRVWRGLAAGRIEQSVEEVVLAPRPHHTVLLNVGPPYRMEERLDGRVYLTHGVRGDVAVIPAGLPVTFRTRERRAQRVDCLAMLLDPAFVRDLTAGAGLDPAAIELGGVLGGRDPAVERIGAALLAELADGGLLGDLYVESLATALAVHLLRNHSSLGRAPGETERGPAGGLSPAELRRVTDYVEANLDGTLTLAGMAGVVHLSAFHFARLFARATGRPPHRFVVERRVARAQALLADPALPLHEVAHRAGFADQSHLARHVRRHLGTTPGALRRAAG
jgi:AraC family transcriptional regulator